MTDNAKSTLWALAVVALLAALVVLAFAARSAYTPPGDLPLTVTAAASLSPASLTATSPPTDTDTATAYLTATPAATDTPPPSPTAEVWQQCRVTAPLRVRNAPGLAGDVLRMLAVDDVVTIDANVWPRDADGYRWFAAVGGGWVAEGWMVCG